MNAIERYSNWCSIDRLDGIDLKDGELLIIRWPDGQFGQVQLCVETGTFEIGEQGGDFQARRSHASVIAYHRGVQVRVPVVGLEAQRVDNA